MMINSNLAWVISQWSTLQKLVRVCRKGIKMAKPPELRKKPPNKTSIKPGQVLNPTGRPKKGDSLAEILRQIGELRDIKDKNEYMERKTALAHRSWQTALAGDTTMIRFLYTYLEPPTQKIETSKAEEIEEIKITVVSGEN